MICRRVQHVSILAALATILLGGTTATTGASELRQRSLAMNLDRVCIDEERRVGIDTPKTVESCSNARRYDEPRGVDTRPASVTERAGGPGVSAGNGLGRERSAAARERGNGANNGFGNGGGDGVPGKSDKSDVDR